MTSTHLTLRWEDHFGKVDRATVNRHVLNEDNHAHDHDFMELAIILGGEAIHGSSLGETPIGKGTAVLLRPGTWHAYLQCQNLDVVNFCFPSSLAGTDWRHLLDDRVRSVLRSGNGLQIAKLTDFATDALERLERVQRHSTGAIGLIIWALDQFAGSLPVRGDAPHPAVEKAVSELEGRPNFQWTSQKLAHSVGLDKAYLSRLFTTHLGVGPMAYLAMLRLERAASLLRNSNMNCGEIGFAVGYSDANLFSRRFRDRFGLSPTAYRARAKSEELQVL